MPRKKRPLRARAPGFAAGQARDWRLALPAVVGAALLVGAAAVPTADAKSPGSRYCFNGFCHRVGTLAQTDTLVGWRGYLLASYYDSCHLDRLNPCGLTSSGAVFRPDLPDNAASPLLPDGTVILAYNPKTGDASVLRVTNAGPYSGKRKLDVSRAAAEKLGFQKQGVAPLVVTVLQSPTKAEASYARKREYAAVPGYLGRFETIDIALDAARERFDSREDGDGPAGETGEALETALLGDDLVPRPRLAVSPSLAREMTMLRSEPRPVSRPGGNSVRLVQGPRPMTRADFEAKRSGTATDPEPAGPTLDFASGLAKYLPAPSASDEAK